jgi:hypothetical protein
MNPVHLHWRRAAAQPWLLAPLLVFLVYLLSMPRTVTFEDDGLFLMAAAHAGIPHPPGYPLYVLIGHLVSHLPVGTVPIRLHALSAAFGGAACLAIGLIAMRLTGSNIVAFMSAAAFGVSKTFWSQSIIAEVYAPNALLVFLLLWLALRATPVSPQSGNGATPDKDPWNWFALLYGLSLSLHWPLVLLSTPALAVLAWPHRRHIARRGPVLLLLLLAGLSPYAWMIWRSQSEVFVNFYGPMQSMQDAWYFLSRQGYTGVDVSPTAGLTDKVRFAGFLARDTAAQFGMAGLLLAAAGFAAQWRNRPAPLGTALTLLFLGNSAALLFLVYFDYDGLTRAAFSVYPHLAYGVMSLWLGLGLWTVREAMAPLVRKDRQRTLIVAALGALILCVQLVRHADSNWRGAFTAADDYGRTLLGALPPDADLFVDGDIPTHVLGYLRHVEGLRPDVTLYNLSGLVFANRLFDPVRTDRIEKLQRIERHVDGARHPVCTTSRPAPGLPEADSWLFSCLAPRGSAERYRIALSAEIAAYFRGLDSLRNHPDGWTAYQHDMLVKRAGEMLGRAAALGLTDVPIAAGEIAAITRDFHGALGYLEGLTSFPDRPPALNDMIRVINGIPSLPPAARKPHRARFLALRAMVNEQAGDRGRAMAEFEESIDIWPSVENEAVANLLRMYRQAGNVAGFERIRRRFPSVAVEPGGESPR